MKVPITTGREYHYSLRSKSAALIAALLLITFGLNAESLWDSDFEGYIADGAALQIGDIISVTVTPNTTLTLDSSRVNLQEGRLSFSGGEGESLFSFLPQGSSNSSKELEEQSSYTLETEIPVRITGRDENGLLSLEGSRTVELNNKTETLRISGQCSAESVTSQRKIRFNDLYNAMLEYSSPGLRTEEVITEADLREPEPADAAPADELVPAEDADEEAETATGLTQTEEPAAPVYQLSDEKQRELLLQYFNRFIDSIFEPVE